MKKDQPFTASYANDFQGEMRNYILQEFGDLLGEHASLLDSNSGLDELANIVRTGKLKLNL